MIVFFCICILVQMCLQVKRFNIVFEVTNALLKNPFSWNTLYDRRIHLESTFITSEVEFFNRVIYKSSKKNRENSQRGNFHPFSHTVAFVGYFHTYGFEFDTHCGSGPESRSLLWCRVHCMNSEFGLGLV